MNGDGPQQRRSRNTNKSQSKTESRSNSRRTNIKTQRGMFKKFIVLISQLMFRHAMKVRVSSDVHQFRYHYGM